MSAPSLSRKLGTPVINYGLHAGLGIDVIAERAAQVIKPGDIVVFAPELSHFRKGEGDDYSDDLRIDFLAAHPSPIDPALQTTPIREWYRARSRCNRIKSKAERSAGSLIARFVEDHLAPAAATAGTYTQASDDPKLNPYDPAAIGPDGEITAPRPAPNPPSRWMISDPPTRADQLDLENGRGTQAFVLLEATCRKRRASLWVMPPMRLAVERFKPILPAIEEMERLAIGMMTHRGAKLLMAPGDTVLGPMYGFDTDYHLNDQGVALMEPKLEAALRAAIDAAPTSQAP